MCEFGTISIIPSIAALSILTAGMVVLPIKSSAFDDLDIIRTPAGWVLFSIKFLNSAARSLDAFLVLCRGESSIVVLRFGIESIESSLSEKRLSTKDLFEFMWSPDAPAIWELWMVIDSCLGGLSAKGLIGLSMPVMIGALSSMMGGSELEAGTGVGLGVGIGKR